MIYTLQCNANTKKKKKKKNRLCLDSQYKSPQKQCYDCETKANISIFLTE